MARRSCEGPRLYKKPGSRYWWADTYNDGRRVRRSTGQVDRAKALQAAQQLAAGETRKLATTVEDVLELRHEDLEKRVSRGEARPNTLLGFETAKRAILLGLDGRMAAVDLTPEVLGDFLERQRKRKRRHTNLEGPLSSWYLSRMVRELRAALRLAFEKGHVDVAVHERLRRRVRRELPKVDVLSSEERERLVEAAEPAWFRRFLVIAAACGPRISELLAAERAGVRFFEDAGIGEAAEIFIGNSKTGAPRTLHVVHAEIAGQRTIQVTMSHYVAHGAVSARARAALARLRR